MTRFVLRLKVLLLFTFTLVLNTIAETPNSTSDTLSGYENELADIFYAIHEYMPSDAQDEINALRLRLQTDLSAATDSGKQAIIQRISDKLDWYQVLLYERSRKYYKAKRLLRHIRKSRSHYAPKACKRLNFLRYRLVV